MSNRIDTTAIRYGIAFVGVALATWARLLLDPALGDNFPLATFFFAILATAWYAGFGPAVVSVIVGVLASDYFLIPPRGSFGLKGWDQNIGMLLYLSVGAGIVWIAGQKQSSRDRDRVRELRAGEDLSHPLISPEQAIG